MRTHLKNHNEVAHFWANQSQTEGKAGNIFFEGKSIYSYGKHFEIARIVTAPNKMECVLFTTRDYSVSTTHHKSIVWRAINQKMFTVPSFDNTKENIDTYLKKIVELQAKQTRAKSNNYGDDLNDTINEAFDYCNYFRIKSIAIRKWVTLKDDKQLFSPAELKKIKDQQAKFLLQKKAERQAKELRLQNQKAEFLAELEKWKNGEIERCPYNWQFPTDTLLRISDDRIQTSKGAEITVKCALRLWNALKTNTADNMVLDNNYTVNDVNPSFIKIGCHQIPMSEINRIAQILNV